MTHLIGPDCTLCGVCLFACPRGAMVEAAGRFVIVAELCDDCAECVSACPSRAIVCEDERSADRTRAHPRPPGRTRA